MMRSAGVPPFLIGIPGAAPAEGWAVPVIALLIVLAFVLLWSQRGDDPPERSSAEREAERERRRGRP